MFPFIFVTIACGAISGFHSLVASGTTSKQLDKFQDARVIGYGGMLGEGALATIATLAVAAGLSDWHAHYHTWNASGILAISHFVKGANTFLSPFGLPDGFGYAFIAVLVISFAATSMDTAARIQRLLVMELGKTLKFKPLQNRYIATVIAVVPAIPLVLAGQEVWGALWLLFGTTNQLIGGLALLTLCVYLYKSKKPMLAYVLPMLFVMTVTSISMITNLCHWGSSFIHQDTQVPFITLVLGGIIFFFECWMIVETILVIKTMRKR